MNPWEAVGNAIGWLVFGVVVLIGVILAVALVGVLVLIVVSVVQEGRRAIKSDTRPRVGVTTLFKRTPKDGTQ